eukprot:2737424-Amphidinium_carterae.1
MKGKVEGGIVGKVAGDVKVVLGRANEGVRESFPKDRHSRWTDGGGLWSEHGVERWCNRCGSQA